MTKKFFSCNKKTKKVKKGRQKTFLSEKRQFCRFYDKKTKKVIFHHHTPDCIFELSREFRPIFVRYEL